ncbi:hypothetical protein COO91_01448 [Nostoc flagelliforme CCNUN1]|uniref:Uncharacterized protein n=1 Tax=Nostoc flagelliforme CCNUN1 TaxID=2038116 RepID=A0A2K8SJN1_9NOSO|nr:hypothetical protein COO91_01448 [Nostoc flagelliforme CCNUN1]
MKIFWLVSHKVNTLGVRQEGQEFWQDFLKYTPIIGIECVK